MNIVMAIHIAAGILALPAGTVAAAAPKGRTLHARAGNLFFASMLVLGVTAAMLEPFRSPTPGSPVAGLIVCYFVATSWVAARRRDGVGGRFEIAACAAALGMGSLTIWGALDGATTPAGSGPLFALAGLLLVAGLGDLNVILRRRLRPAQRISRHLWRMCFAFFIATGSFFIGQQDILPATMRGSPVLLVLGFAPLAIIAFWLVRLRFARMAGKLPLRMPVGSPSVPAL